jgi:prophage tail gpP-like protein
MPKPAETCFVFANGQRYDIWETVEVRTSTDDVIDHAMLTVAEPSTGASKLSQLKLQPGDKATVSLGGQTVLSGLVYLRQGAMDANSHAVQIGISSIGQSVIASTVDAAPGQYTNQTLQQIASAVSGKVNVPFSINGSPADADKPFPRISENIGETRFDFILRLCRMRNLHMVDDGQNGIVAFRGSFGKSTGVLQEGNNILRARILLKNNEHAENITAVGQTHGNDSADANSQSSASTTVDPPINRNVKIACEEMADNQDCQHRANDEADWVKYNQVDGEVTVQGWFKSDGGLWWNDRRKTIVVNSPLLLPNNSFGFMIKGVTHRQNSQEGTTTDILLCRSDGLGAGGEPITRNN